MLHPVFLSLLAIVATVTGAGMIVPQVVRLHRHQTLQGVSAAWVGVGLAMNIWWLVYGFANQLWGILPVSIGAIIFYGVLAFQMVRIGGRSTLSMAASRGVAIALLPLISLSIGGWTAAGLAIGLCYGIQFLPAVITAVRSMNLTGLSTATWVMALIEAVCWVIYGTATGDIALLVGGSLGAAMAIVVVLRLRGTIPPVQRYPFHLAQ